MKTNRLIILLIIFSLLLITLSAGVISLVDKQFPLSLFDTKELASPSDWIKEEQIKVYNNKVVIEIQNSTWASFTNTNSMDPFLDEDAHAIEIKPQDPNEINKGDVISYKTSYGTVIHRIISKGIDEEGIYYLVKGDNNQIQDPFKVRYEDVKGVVVAIVY